MNKKMQKGFTLVEIMIVVAIIAILAAIAIPNFIAYRKESQANACTSTMASIKTAAESWASKPANQGQTPTMSDICGADKFIKIEPKCNGKEYEIGKGQGGEFTVTCKNTDCPNCGLSEEEQAQANETN